MSIATNMASRSSRWMRQATRVHAVGAAPIGAGGDPLSTMQWHADHRHGALMDALPFDVGGRWIIDWLDERDQVPGLVKIRDGASRGYDDIPYYAVADGHRLSRADLVLGRPQLTAAAFAVYDDVVGDDLPRRLQVSIPNALDLAFFVAGSAEASAEWMPDLQSMVAAEVSEISARWGSRVVLQLESLAVLLAYDRTPRQDWALLTSELVQQVAGILVAAPQAAWVLHLCYGDLAHEALIEPTDLTAAVQFLNGLDDFLVDLGLPMPTVHLPLAHGDNPPPTDPAFYTALRRLHRGIAVIAGLVAENHPQQTRASVDLVVEALGGLPDGIGAGCGHGRRSIAAGAANAALAAAITHALNTPASCGKPRTETKPAQV